MFKIKHDFSQPQLSISIPEQPSRRVRQNINFQLFEKRNRFIENYPTSVVEKRLLKPLVHSNVTHARRERFHTELNLDTPPVGYYHITNYASPSAQHHFSRQNRTFDWQHLPSHQSTQPKPVQTIVIHDDDDKQIARQINLSLKQSSRKQLPVKPLHDQEYLNVKLVEIDAQAVNQMNNQLARLRKIIKKLRNDIKLMPEVQLQRLNTSERLIGF